MVENMLDHAGRNQSESFLALHRYFIWANQMRGHFEEVLSKHSGPVKKTKKFWIESNLYMSYWYGGLYVVIEGWRKLQLVDSVIDELLGSKNVELLKRYRNGVFHFQSKYSNSRFTDFMTVGENAVEWIRQLNKEFGRYFRNRILRQ